MDNLPYILLGMWLLIYAGLNLISISEWATGVNQAPYDPMFLGFWVSRLIFWNNTKINNSHYLFS